MKTYLDIVSNIIYNGIPKTPYRVSEGKNVENSTIGLPNITFSHNMSDGFPLITTRKMHFEPICVELEGFLKGVTSKKWYADKGCNYWNSWCNPKKIPNYVDDNGKYVIDTSTDKDYIDRCLMSGKYRNINEEEIKKCKKEEDDLGPIYGYQLRSFNKVYDEDDSGCVETYDQLKNITDTLETHPYDRRMVASYWNSSHTSRMGLPPCAFAWVVAVYGDTLNLCWVQRSADLTLGVPTDICSFALLLTLLAKHANLKPGNLLGTLIDCHIYDNHIDSMKEQLSRQPLTLPTVEIVQHKDVFSIYDWTYSDVILHNYKHHPKLNLGKITV